MTSINANMNLCVLSESEYMILDVDRNLEWKYVDEK